MTSACHRYSLLPPAHTPLIARAASKRCAPNAAPAGGGTSGEGRQILISALPYPVVGVASGFGMGAPVGSVPSVVGTASTNTGTSSVCPAAVSCRSQNVVWDAVPVQTVAAAANVTGVPFDM